MALALGSTSLTTAYLGSTALMAAYLADVNLLGGAVATDPNVQAVAADGGTLTDAAAQMPSDFAPSSDPKMVTVERPGFDALGAPTTVNEDLLILKRTRVPGSATPLTTDEAAASDMIYASDVVLGASGFTNNSTLAYPKPVCMWATPDMGLIRAGDATFPVRLAVAHPYGRNGKPVNAVRFSLSDGTTTNVVTVSTMSSRLYASGLHGAYFEADLVPLLTGLYTGRVLTVDAVVFPFVGDAFTISADADVYPSPNLTTLRVVNDSDGSYGRAFAYVSPTGNDGTGVASETEAVAKVSPFATLLAAGNALETYNGANFSRNNASGGEIVLEDGTYTHSSLAGVATESTAPVIIRSTGPTSKAAVVYQDPGSHVQSGMPDHVRFENMTIRKVGGNVILFDSGAGLENMDRLNVFDNCVFDQNGTSFYAGWMYRVGRVYLHDCTGIFGFTLTFFSVNKVTNLIGCSGSNMGSCYNVFASKFGGGTFTTQTAAGNRLKAEGQFMGYTHLTTGGQRVVSVKDASSDRGVAVVMSVLERTAVGRTPEPAWHLHAKGNTNVCVNAQGYGNTAVGAHTNWLYNDTGSATLKYGWMRACLNNARNTKADLFVPIDAKRVGNWSVIYQVGHSHNATQEGSAQGGSVGPGSWLGEVAHPADVNGTIAEPLDFLFADDQSFHGGRNGGGDYTPGAATTLPVLPADRVHYPIDMRGRVVPLDGAAVAGALQKA